MLDGVRFFPISLRATRATLLLAGACLLVACWPRSSSAQVFTLGVRLDFATGAEPFWTGVGDLNGDGKPDIVVADFSADAVSVLLGNGSGTFGLKTDFVTGAGPVWGAIGDVNGDGHPDLAVAALNSNSVSVLLGKGDGTFGSKAEFATGSGPYSVAIADVNGDGKPDLVVADLLSNTVSVLLGKGDGTFGGKTDFGTGLAPQALAIGDVNGDGYPDVVTANGNSNTVSVLLGKGDGTFGLKNDFVTGTGPSSVAVADVNGDGKLDLVVSDLSVNKVSVLLGKGDGTFGGKTDFTTDTFGPLYVAVGDLNGDGHPDLVVTYVAGPSGISVLQGNGDGTFLPVVDFAAAAFPEPAIADVNGDGRLDIVTANAGPNTVSVLLNNNGGSFSAESDYAVGTNPSAIAIGDVSGDGRPDIETSNYASNTVSILQGNSAGGFFSHSDFGTGASPMAVAVADLNGDGHRDIVTAGFATAPNESSVLLNNGVGGFATHVDYSTGLSADGVAVGDVNGNGKPDLVTANATGNSISVLLGNGNGTFGLNHDFATGASPASVALADLNGDGNLDAVTANSAGSSVSVLIGDGNGNFPSHVEYPTGANPQSVAIGDVNGDGIPDLVVADANPPGSPPGHVSILIGNGGGTFLAHVDLSTVGSRPYSVALADVNGDGHLDIITACMYSDAAYVMLGDGAGGFGPPYGYHAGPGNFIGSQFPLAAAVNDLNGDGHADIALADYGSGAVSVLYGLTSTQIKLGLSQSLSQLGSSLTLTGTLTVPPSGPAPLGTVRFFDGFTSLGSVRVIGGVATLHWTPPTLGGHTLSAVYSGDGNFFSSISPTAVASVVTDVGVDGAGGPQTVYLSAPSPNPARSGTAFRFGLPHDAQVSLRVYDVTGRLVRKLGDGRYAPGEHLLNWDLRDEAGSAVSAGMFFVRLAADGVTRNGMLVVMP